MGISIDLSVYVAFVLTISLSLCFFLLLLDGYTTDHFEVPLALILTPHDWTDPPNYDIKERVSVGPNMCHNNSIRGTHLVKKTVSLTRT